ncbi:DoxX family protein [Pontibacter chitinilyticus]|uniref:DoxX family protein n=1 Tax=Pontibacter chitinilyticus TaxID=2674989 RepID=UPI00321C3749
MTVSHQFHHTERINSANNPIWMDCLRVALGLFLFIKGILFLEHTSDVFYYFSQHQELIGAHRASLLTSVVHIIGGLMIAFGALTRLSVLCQIPIVLGAIMVVNMRHVVQLGNTELILSIVVLALLVFFMIVGPGRYSVDNKIFRQKTPPPSQE